MLIWPWYILGTLLGNVTLGTCSDERVVGDGVGGAALIVHLLEQVQGQVALPSLLACADQAGVGDHAALTSLPDHLLEHLHIPKGDALHTANDNNQFQNSSGPSNAALATILMHVASHIEACAVVVSRQPVISSRR